MHTLQAIVADFEAFDDCHLNLHELDILNLVRDISVKSQNSTEKDIRTNMAEPTISSRFETWFSVLSRSWSWYRFFLSSNSAFLCLQDKDKAAKYKLTISFRRLRHTYIYNTKFQMMIQVSWLKNICTHTHFKWFLTLFCHLLATALPEVALSPAEEWFSFGIVSAYLSAALIAEKLHTKNKTKKKPKRCR